MRPAECACSAEAFLRILPVAALPFKKIFFTNMSRSGIPRKEVQSGQKKQRSATAPQPVGLNDPKADSRRHTLILCCLLAVVTLIAYHGVGNCDFLSYDDTDYVTQNKFIQHGLSLKSIGWAFTTFYASNWHPLTWLSHMTDWTVFGNHPGPHHLVNAALHTLNSILLLLLLLYLTGNLQRSAVVAFLFALHPIHVESVAWVAERKDVLSTFFWLVTTLAYARYVRRPSWRRMAPVIGAFTFAILAKPMVVTLPFTLLLLDIWPLRRVRLDFGNPGRTAGEMFGLAVEKWPLFLMTFASSIVTYLAQKAGGAVSSEIALPAWVRFCNAAMSYWRYLGKMVWPDPLITYYHHEGRGIIVPLALMAAVGLAFVTVACLRLGKKRPYLIMGWLWYLGTLVPVVGFPVQVGVQAMAERYSYIPLIGIFVALVWLIGDASDGMPKVKPLLRAAAIGVIAVFGVLTMNQVKVWKSTVTLFSHVLQADPRGEFPNLSLGAAYMREKNYSEAQRYLEYALSYNPNGPQTLSYYSFCLMEKAGSGPADLQVVQQCLDRAYLVSPENRDVLVNRAELCNKTGRPAEAEAYCRKILSRTPDFLTAEYYLADALSAQKKYDEAADVYRGVLAADPANSDALNSLGIVLYTEGKPVDAVNAFMQALRVKPNQSEAHSNLGRVYFEQHQVQQAVAELTAAARIDPDNAIVHNNLGAVLFSLHDYAGAVREFGDAVRVNPGYGEARGNLARAQQLLAQPTAVPPVH
jgi:tetratricopeptide (TPR) repeat protein